MIDPLDPNARIPTPELLLNDAEPSENQTPEWTRRRIYYRSLIMGSFGLNLFKTIFFYLTLHHTKEMVLEECDAKDIGELEIVLDILIAILTLNYFLAIGFSVNFSEKAEEYMETNARSTQKKGCSFPRALTTFTECLSFPSFIHLSASQAIAIAGLTRNDMGWYLGLGTPFMLLSLTTLYAFTHGDFEKHAEGFIQESKILFTRKSCAIRIMQSPLRSLEVALEAVSNITYYAIGGGYLVVQLTKIFATSKEGPAVFPWMMVAVGSAALMALSSDVLPFYKFYFDPNYRTIDASERRNTVIPKKTLVIYTFVALSRALSLTLLVRRANLPDGPWKRSLLIVCVFLGSFGHYLYISYQKQLYDKALENRQAASLLNIELQVIGANEHFSQQNSADLFDRIAKTYQTKSLERVISAINFFSGIGQLIAFMGFEIGFTNTLNLNGYILPFDPTDHIYLTILWGGPLVVINTKTHQRGLIDTATTHRAKMLIGAPTRELANANIFKRAACEFFYSKSQYSLDVLQTAMQNLQGEERHEFER